MGDIADSMVAGFESGRRGMPLPKQREYPKATKADLIGKRFSVVEVIKGNTNRTPGMKLVVCEQDDLHYWVHTSNGVTGILKSVCKVLAEDMDLHDAKIKRKILL